MVESAGTTRNSDDQRSGIRASFSAALAVLIERGPGQREERYAHLLGGPVAAPTIVREPASSRDNGLEARLEALEEKVARLAEQLRALTGGT